MIVTAGRTDKHDWLHRLGLKTVLNHRLPDYARQLNNTAPSGITRNFENIGGSAHWVAQWR
ncbi:hypothetical protein ACT3TJ_03205 [Halomonas sp. AOP30-A1-24]|uniref:hypothetical protein n=1 Tax=Halomonas sp. AOP30-A1-24 TaxID=3457698 RepID=UPI004033ACA5